MAVMRLSHVLFAPDGTAVANLDALVAGGRVRGRVVATSGNTGVEALRLALGGADGGGAVAAAGPVVATMHRVENLHSAERFDGFLDLLGRLGRPAVFVVHPPTDAVLADRGGRHRQLVRRLGEGEVPRGGIVYAQGVEGQERALHIARIASQRGRLRQAGVARAACAAARKRRVESFGGPRSSARCCGLRGGSSLSIPAIRAAASGPVRDFPVLVGPKCKAGFRRATSVDRLQQKRRSGPS